MADQGTHSTMTGSEGRGFPVTGTPKIRRIQPVKLLRSSLSALLLLSVSFYCVACESTRPPEAAAIREADQKMVDACTFLGDVSGSSMMANMAAERGRQNAKTGALKQAAKLGATHVVWTSVTSGMDQGSQANGKAYRCAQ